MGLTIRRKNWQVWGLIAAWLGSNALRAESRITPLFEGVTYSQRKEVSPRPVTIHVVQIDLTAPGIRFKLTPPSGTRETQLQTTLDFLNQEHAQVAISAHFYVPFPAPDANVNVVGFAASEGNLYSGFEPQPVATGYIDQSYAILAYAPALNIDPSNRVSIIHRDPTFPDNRHMLEPVIVWNALSGSSQIVRNGFRVIPSYSGSHDGLNPLNGYSDLNPWNSQLRARVAVGVGRGGSTLVLLTVEQAGESLGMTTGEVADLLIRDYQVEQAINLDGGPSTTLVIEDVDAHTGRVASGYWGSEYGVPVGSNLAVFARPLVRIPPALAIDRATLHHVVLSWPTTPNWHLERNSVLAPDGWTAVAANPGAATGRWEVTLTPDVVDQFYRLSP